MKKDKVLLIVNTSKSISEGAVGELIDVLLSSGVRVVSHDSARDLICRSSGGEKVELYPDEIVPEGVSFAVVLGGDGSIIRAASLLCREGIPMVGVNFGAVGYLAELESEDIPSVRKILDGDYEIDSRMMLEAEVKDKNGDLKASLTALNDIVLSNGPVANLLSFDLFCDGIRLRNFRADGVILATATGSTAYSLSAGGPILDPTLSAICVTPICPHSLGDRPVVVNGNSVIELCNIKSRKNSIYVTSDGRSYVSLDPEDTVKITRSKLTTKLIRLKSNGFLGVLSNKLSI